MQDDEHKSDPDIEPTGVDAITQAIVNVGKMLERIEEALTRIEDAITRAGDFLS